MEEMFQTVIAGYFIFCLQNRLWGRSEMETALSYADVTFPTPFSSIGYKIALTDYNSGITTTITAPVNF